MNHYSPAKDRRRKSRFIPLTTYLEGRRLLSSLLLYNPPGSSFPITQGDPGPLIKNNSTSSETVQLSVIPAGAATFATSSGTNTLTIAPGQAGSFSIFPQIDSTSVNDVEVTATLKGTLVDTTLYDNVFTFYRVDLPHDIRDVDLPLGSGDSIPSGTDTPVTVSVTPNLAASGQTLILSVSGQSPANGTVTIDGNATEQITSTTTVQLRGVTQTSPGHGGQLHFGFTASQPPGPSSGPGALFGSGFSVTSQPKIAMTSATISADGQSVIATYTISGANLTSPGTVDFYWASGPTLADKIDTTSDLPTPMVPTNTKVSTNPYTASTSIASLGTRPTNATYILAVADSPNVDPANSFKPVLAPATVFPASRGWDVAKGGIDFDYQVTGTLSANVPVAFYWSSSETFNAAQDTLAASDAIEADQSSSPTSLGFMHIPASSLTIPPEGTTNLLIVIDPTRTVLKIMTDVVSLGYDPEFTITSKYDGNPTANIFGRFLAAPGIITDETLTVKLSDSLAALRPTVWTTVEDASVNTPTGPAGVLLADPVVGSSGSWDGRTYETDAFDPGSLSEPTVLTTQALASDGTSLQRASDTFDVQPLPEWITQSDSHKDLEFDKNSNAYTLKTLLANLALPSNAVIPARVPLLGGLPVGASAGFGINAQIPLAITVPPTVAGYAEITLTAAGFKVFDKSYDASATGGTDENGSFTATPEFALDPDTLQPDSGFGVEFSFKSKDEVIAAPLYNGVIQFYGVPIPLHLNTNDSIDLAAAANVALTPGSGFTFVPGQASVTLGLTATLTGSVGYDVSFPKKKAVVVAKLQAEAVGSLTVNSTVTYSGNSTTATPHLVTFGGVFDPKLDGVFSVKIGKHTKQVKSPNLLKSVAKLKIPYKFKL